MFDTMGNLLVLIVALPLAAAVVTTVLGPLGLRRWAHVPAVAAIAVSFVCSALLVYHVNVEQTRHEVEQTRHEQDAARPAVGFERTYTIWTWVDVREALAGRQSAVDHIGSAGVSPANETAQSQGSAGVSPADIIEQRPAARRTVASGPFDFDIGITLRADALTAMMLAMVTFISSLVAIYSIGYMHGDRGYWRFFAYISLFVFSMTMLVSVSNFVLLYVFWEGVGLCSYLLIGFWYEKPEAAAAGKKAFLVNRIGDFGFALALFLIWTTYGTLNYHDTPAASGRTGETVAAAEAAGAANAQPETTGAQVDSPQVHGVLGQWRLQRGKDEFVGGGVGLAICLLLMLGACGKSAQFPLHVWLPDAMEGPSPVSALIHAATMVTAGVYMVARCTPLFVASAEAQMVVAAIGGFTALLAALIALTQFDLKRILAYSTISQLGYMFLALGAGTLAGITAGMFHLLTHAFFKALLFLGAGSVMHAMGNVIDIRRFGGLRRLMPITHWTFLFGCLALAGVFPFAGFWSKDAIVAAVHDRAAHHSGGGGGFVYLVLYYGALLTALLTAFYTFRAFFVTFYGREQVPPEAGEHAHESPGVMWAPLAILAAGSLVVGAYFEWTSGFADFLGHAPSLAYGPIAVTTAPGEFHLDVAAWSTALALAGVGLAALLYLGSRGRIERLASLLRPESLGRLSPYDLSHGKFYFDEIYGALVVWPLRILAAICHGVDDWLIDGLVNLCGYVPKAVGAVARSLQMGLVQFYALAMVLGVLVLVAVRILWVGW